MNSEEILTQRQFEEANQQIEKRFRLKPEDELDNHNHLMNLQKKVKQTRYKSKETSLSSVEACSKVINKILIQHQEQWIQDMCASYMKKVVKPDDTKNVFSRLSKDVNTR